jgi:hypothetical protein
MASDKTTFKLIFGRLEEKEGNKGGGGGGGGTTKHRKNG